ncbi:MAG: winged helix-turn-helix domain-containing protein [Aliivibrio sp.]|uniref:winged helix-turn-helix domain-containing protein n=1 Tax=Aliivibrio sp. TaxID=1872443 RepID=UPI001A3E423E|nr:winged helix-turn-helix domain-containing protein [Aliivibrio sp.]
MNKAIPKIMLGQRFIFNPTDNSLIDELNESKYARLGTNESRVLSLMIKEAGNTISRNQLQEYVWRDQGFEVDDSSLTQAISTLRKMLNDSTKSPVFIKTVPKRGYQFIATVKMLTSGDELASSNSTEQETIQGSAPVEDNIDATMQTQPQKAAQIEASTDTVPLSTLQTKAPSSLNRWLMLIAAVLLPLLAYSSFSPKSSAFIQIATYDETPILVPLNHPDISNWKPLIERCVIRYNQSHTATMKPMEVIATSGQEEQLILNYIHSLEHSSESVTVRLLIDQVEVDNVCS